MTAKEQLLEEVAAMSEPQAASWLDVIERERKARDQARNVDEWGDLDAMLDAEAADVMRELDEEERAAGYEPWHK